MSEEFGESIASTVPELFYDLIGRIIPGTAILIVFLKINSNWIVALPGLPDHSTFLGGSILVLGVYLLGITLDALGLILFTWMFDRLGTEVHSLSRRTAKRKRSLAMRLIPRSSREQWTWVRKRKKSGDSVPLKIRAEVLMFRSLSLGLLAAFIVVKAQTWALLIASFVSFLCAYIVSVRLTSRIVEEEEEKLRLQSGST